MLMHRRYFLGLEFLIHQLVQHRRRCLNLQNDQDNNQVLNPELHRRRHHRQ
jgi:hypothetical protein